MIIVCPNPESPLLPIREGHLTSFMVKSRPYKLPTPYSAVDRSTSVLMLQEDRAYSDIPPYSTTSSFTLSATNSNKRYHTNLRCFSSIS